MHGSKTLSLKIGRHVKYGEMGKMKPIVAFTILRTHLKINGRVA